ncbi:protein FAR1-RELATED SEQUENCE 3-like [Cucumis melo var. makuwa]|uniref:Protein FAR1-RELATED SEQUENCE 3-like n=1 Tax=Cucumis melo var. makuwa TaxID=1194695 RepID=A0A5D3CX11_CUCMM|nr:protein FAR1-RELATED SEQUENCE 3-like [Cucumis melo var. makuwa]
MRVSLNSLVALICEQLELDQFVELSVLLDFGKSNVQTVVPIKKDNNVAWYLAFAKDATSRHPLVAHVSVNGLGMSSSSSSVWENVDMSLNIGICTALEMDGSGHFKFCFMAFGASIEGWKYCRPIIYVDRTFLKYFENDGSWTWFFEKIRGSFSERANLVIVSDRHLSILKEVLRVFPDVEYYVCTKHLLSNLELHFKDSLLDKYFFTCGYNALFN